MRKFLRWLLLVSSVLAVAAAIGAFFLYRASQQVPSFYQHALQSPPVDQEQAGNDLERQVLELHNEVRETGRWEVVFTDQQINGWLAVHLPAKWAQALPVGVSEPRVAITPERILVACKYEAANLQTVVSLAVEVHLTDEPNVVAVRIRQSRAGALPVPLSKFLDRISAKARDAEVQLRWQQDQGDPVALITIPIEHEQYIHRQIYVESIELRDGAIRLAGYTDEEMARRQRTVSRAETNHLTR